MKIIEFRKLIREEVKKALNEGISFKISGDLDNLSEPKEKKAAEDFTWSPPSVPVTVKAIEMEMMDEYNGYANIVMSNGDTIIYDLYESRNPGPGQKAPPFYKFSLTVNGKKLTPNLDDVLQGSGSITADILGYYVKHYLSQNIK